MYSDFLVSYLNVSSLRDMNPAHYFWFQSPASERPKVVPRKFHDPWSVSIRQPSQVSTDDGACDQQASSWTGNDYTYYCNHFTDKPIW